MSEQGNFNDNMEASTNWDYENYKGAKYMLHVGQTEFIQNVLIHVALQT